MKKLLTVLLASAIVCGLPGCTDAKFNYEKVANKALATSVLIRMKIKVKDKQGKEHTLLGGCSGTFISNDKILSAGHCFSEEVPMQIWIRDANGISYTAKLIKLDKAHDLGLLQVKGLHHKYSKIGKRLHVAEEIMNIGSPYDLEFLVSHGVVSALDVEVKEFRSVYTITDAAINPGSSGGGVFNSKGELVGVNTMSEGFFGWSGISYAVSIKDIKHFLGK